MQEVLTKEFVTVQEDKERSLIIVSWKGLCSSADYREVMTEAVNRAEKNELIHWITDNSNAKILRVDDQEWLMETIIPRAKKIFKKVCVIDSKDVFRNVGVSTIQRDSKQKEKFIIKNFAKLEDAYEWLS